MTPSPFANQPPSRRATSKSARNRTIAISLLGLAIVVGLFALFSGSAEEAPAPPKAVTEGSPTVRHVDGTLTVVETDRLVIEPFGGKPEMTFVITEEDRANFDIAHMQSHSSVALPTRIYYERDGERLLARYKEDAPVNSQDDGE